MDRKSARERGYDTRWDKARKWYLRHHPLCRYCTREGKIEAAIVVDHIKPHKGNMVLFWDQDNWQPLCKPHHDSTKRREEHGKSHGCDENGNPLGGWAA